MSVEPNRLPATLEVIDYERIQNQDHIEVSKMLRACRPPPRGSGIFFLDISGPSANNALTHLQAINSGILTYFHQSMDAKMDAFREGIDRGYKCVAKVWDSFEISLDEERQGTHKLPPGLEQCQEELSSVLSTCDTVTRNILMALCPSADLGPAGPSDSGLKLYLQHAEVPSWEVTAPPHTDTGLLTLMFYDVPCMEVAVSGKAGQQWAPLNPRDGCVVVHVADALQAKGNGALRSPLHRVVQPEPVPEDGTPLTIYYLRPAYQSEEQQVAI